jgi:hypothetical protein
MRNEDQPIQAPMKNENLVDDFVEGEFEDIDEDINMMEGGLSDKKVTQEEYEKSLSFNSILMNIIIIITLIIHHLNIGFSHMPCKLKFIENMNLEQGQL